MIEVDKSSKAAFERLIFFIFVRLNQLLETHFIVNCVKNSSDSLYLGYLW